MESIYERKLPENIDDLIYNLELDGKENAAKWFRQYDGHKVFLNPLDVKNPNETEIPEEILDEMFQAVRTKKGEYVYSGAELRRINPSEVYLLQTVYFEYNMENIYELLKRYEKPLLLQNSEEVSIYMPPIVEKWNKDELKGLVIGEDTFKNMPEEVYVLIDGVHRMKALSELGETATIVLTERLNGKLPAKIYGKISDLKPSKAYIPSDRPINDVSKYIGLNKNEFRMYNEIGFGKFDTTKK